MKCLTPKCGKEIELQEALENPCPKCGGNFFKLVKPPVVKKEGGE